MRLDSSFSINFVLKVDEIPCVKVQRQKMERYMFAARILIYPVPEADEHFTELSHLTHM